NDNHNDLDQLVLEIVANQSIQHDSTHRNVAELRKIIYDGNDKELSLKVQKWVNNRIDLAKEWYLSNKDNKFDINYVVVRGNFKAYYLGVKSEPSGSSKTVFTMIDNAVEKFLNKKPL
ncbi:hypothetical protein, partial [Klebsiella pneumoniae]|uniref:hypothetical protein n=1 Tax=Klebsiella pneumoniae TaxID=573 RepID=UPI00200CA31B